MPVSYLRIAKFFSLFVLIIKYEYRYISDVLSYKFRTEKMAEIPLKTVEVSNVVRVICNIR